MIKFKFLCIQISLFLILSIFTKLIVRSQIILQGVPETKAVESDAKVGCIRLFREAFSEKIFTRFNCTLKQKNIYKGHELIGVVKLCSQISGCGCLFLLSRFWKNGLDLQGSPYEPLSDDHFHEPGSHQQTYFPFQFP